MAKEPPRRSDIPKSDLFTLGGFSWAITRKIGEGSYGKVYLGWSEGNEGGADVAVKHIKKEHLVDAKVCKNMQREIDILHALSDCPSIVRLWKDVNYGGDLVLFMELCDGDLDQRIQKIPFNSADTKSFLAQMAEGMRVLRDRHVVHRDLKPQNILIKYEEGKMQFKIADFGFARFFKEENTKDVTIDVMYSLAGTPVFMAPEALKCVMTHGKTPYDEKVDLWSVGALLYKCLVGHCGFFAHMNQILPILEKKKDAIAFSRPKKPGESIKYLYELPQEVQDRLPQHFCKQVTALLKDLLKVRPEERLSFEAFFSQVEVLTRNNIELLDVSAGSVERMNLSQYKRTSDFIDTVSQKVGVPPDSFLLFSNDAKWLSVPWSNAHASLSQLNSQHLEESDPVVYVIRLTSSGGSFFPPGLKSVEEAETLIKKLPQFGSIAEPLKRLVGSTPGGLATTQYRQLQGLASFWLFVVSKYRKHCSRLKKAERMLAQFHGNVVASVDSLRLLSLSLVAINGGDSSALRNMEGELEHLEAQQPKLTQKLSKFNDDIAVLAELSTSHFTHTHQQLELDLTRLQDGLQSAGKVELSQMSDIYKRVIFDLRKHVNTVHCHIEEGFSKSVKLLRTLESANAAVGPLVDQFEALSKDANTLLKSSFAKMSQSLSDATMKGETVVIEVAAGDKESCTEEPPKVCSDCDLKDQQLQENKADIAQMKDMLSQTIDSPSQPEVESTLTTTNTTTSDPEGGLERTMDVLIEQLKDALLEENNSSSLCKGYESFVVCESDDNGLDDNQDKMVEITSLLSKLEIMRSGHLPSEPQGAVIPDSYIKIAFDYNSGDLVLLMPTKVPEIFVALTRHKERVFVDKDCVKGHEKDFKQSCLPGAPFMVGRVLSPPLPVQASTHNTPAHNYAVKPQPLTMKCEPFVFPKH